MLGHDGPPTNYWERNLVTNEPLTRCPVRTLQLAPKDLVAEVDRYVNTYYPAYQDGFLLAAGGLSDQPARYVELIQLTRHYDRLVQQKYEETLQENQDD